MMGLGAISLVSSFDTAAVPFRRNNSVYHGLHQVRKGIIHPSWYLHCAQPV